MKYIIKSTVIELKNANNAYENYFSSQFETTKKKPDLKINFTPKIKPKYYKTIGISGIYDKTLFLKTPKKRFYQFDPYAKDLLVENNTEPEWLFNNMIHNMISLDLLKKNTLLLHATAFEYNNKGILLFGPGGSKRTSIALNSLKHNTRLISDDYTILSDKISRYQNTIKLCSYLDSSGLKDHLDYLKNKSKKLELMQKINKTLQNTRSMRKIKGLRFLHNRIAKRSAVSINYPLSLFPNKKEHSLDIFVLIMPGKSCVKKARPLELIEQIIQINRQESKSFISQNIHFKYAFPEKKDILENIEKKQRLLLKKYLKNKPCFILNFEKPKIDILTEKILELSKCKSF